MKKEFSARDYVEHADRLLRSARVVVSNLAFNAAGLAAGEEDLHREKLLKSIIHLKATVDVLLKELADEEDVERATRELTEEAIAEALERFKKECGE